MTVQDEGFHEIQLNGKQVVFLFMAATVVSVVIFLCGVLVGRGVRVDRPTMADLGPGSAQVETAPPTAQPAPAVAASTGSDPRAAAPPPDTDDLSYFNRLETKTPPRETLKRENLKSAVEKRVGQADAVELTPVASKTTDKAPSSEKPAAPEPATTTAQKQAPVQKEAAPKEPPKKEPARAAAPPAALTPAAAPAPVAAAPSAPPAAAAATDATAGSGFAVQIAALNVRGEAEAIARRLNSKGYAAYVLVPSDGTPSVFRVRIGKFPTRHEAETVAAKLKKEEQFNPWVTR